MKKEIIVNSITKGVAMDLRYYSQQILKAYERNDRTSLEYYAKTLNHVATYLEGHYDDLMNNNYEE